MNDRVTVIIQDGVADVRLVRADKMNALDDAMFSALIETGDWLKTQGGVRAVVLSGEGRAFCAGLDMGSFQCHGVRRARQRRRCDRGPAHAEAHRGWLQPGASTPAWSGARSPCR